MLMMEGNLWNEAVPILIDANFKAGCSARKACDAMSVVIVYHY